MSTCGKICVRCEVEFRCLRNGICLVEMTTHGACAVYQADLWRCPVCQWQAIVGVGREPVAIGEGSIEVDREIMAAKARGEKVVRFWVNNREREQYFARQIHPPETTDIALEHGISPSLVRGARRMGISAEQMAKSVEQDFDPDDSNGLS